MFIYILNLLNDSLRKNNLCRVPAFEIISDTTYISRITDIKKNFDFNNFSDKIINVFEIFNKYKLTLTDSMGILNKLILNANYLWVLEKIHNEIYISSKDKLELDLSYIVHSILQKYRIEKMMVC
jgi:hypothetical protein